MSINQTGTIDIISANPEGNIVLTISDHHSWEETWHFQLLEDKINAYLQFIESGQIFEEYPNSIGKKLVIETAMKYKPTSEALSFLEKIKDIVEGAGIEFRWKVIYFDE